MNTLNLVSASILAVALAACGASEPAPAQPMNHPGHAGDTTPAAHDQGKAHHEGAGHSHDFPAPVTAFHDVMSPRWHAEPGPQRQDDTCAAIAAFKDTAATIGTHPVPEKAAAQEGSWHNAVADLNIAIGGLEAACAADGRAGFDDAFHELHEAFHRLVALIGHDQHGEGEHGEGHQH